MEQFNTPKRIKMIQQVLIIIYLTCKILFKILYLTTQYTYKYCRILYLIVKKYRENKLYNQHNTEEKTLTQLAQVKQQDATLNDTTEFIITSKVQSETENQPQIPSQKLQEDQSIAFDQFDVNNKEQSLVQIASNDRNQISQLHSDSSGQPIEQTYQYYQNSRCERILMHIETFFDIEYPEIKDIFLQELYNVYMKESDKFAKYKIINCMAICIDRSNTWLQSQFDLQTKDDVYKFISDLKNHLFWSQCSTSQDLMVKGFVGMCNQFLLIDNYLQDNSCSKTKDFYFYLFNDFEKKLLVNPNFNLQENNILARQTTSNEITMLNSLEQLQSYLQYDIIMEVKEENSIIIKEMARSLCCYSPYCNYNVTIKLITCQQLINLSLTNVSWPKITGQLNIQYLALCKVNDVNYSELSSFLKVKYLYARKILFSQQNEQETGNLLLQTAKKYYHLESLIISCCMMPKVCVINFPMRYLRVLFIEYMDELNNNTSKKNNFIIDSNMAQLEELEILCLHSRQKNINLSIQGDFKFEQLYFISVSGREAFSVKK